MQFSFKNVEIYIWWCDVWKGMLESPNPQWKMCWAMSFHNFLWLTLIHVLKVKSNFHLMNISWFLHSSDKHKVIPSNIYLNLLVTYIESSLYLCFQWLTFNIHFNYHLLCWKFMRKYKDILTFLLIPQCWDTTGYWNSILWKTGISKVHNQNRGCWWPEDTRSQGISSNGIGLVILFWSQHQKGENNFKWKINMQKKLLFIFFFRWPPLSIGRSLICWVQVTSCLSMMKQVSTLRCGRHENLTGSSTGVHHQSI